MNYCKSPRIQLPLKIMMKNVAGKSSYPTEILEDRQIAHKGNAISLLYLFNVMSTDF